MSIVLERVSAGYVSGVPILDCVSMSVGNGTCATVLGPNGSGKSTLLKTIMGYLPPYEGAIVVDDQDVTKIPVHRRALEHGLAYVPQLDNVFGPLTVRENLEMGGATLSGRVRRQRVSEVFDQYPQLAKRRNQRAESQSGGERQVLAVARALMTRPRYILLDEPSAGLSPLMLTTIFEMLNELRIEHGVTLLVVEQNAAQSLAISDEGHVLVMGKVALHGTASDLLRDSSVAELYLGGAPSGHGTDPSSRP